MTGGAGLPPGPGPRGWDRRSFVKLGAVSAALAAAAGCTSTDGTPPATIPSDVADWVVARLKEAHDPRDFGAYWDGSSHVIGKTADSTGHRGPYGSLDDAKKDFPWVTDLTNEWDWVGLTAASEAAGAVTGAVRLPAGEGRIDQLWRPAKGISVFGAGVDTTVVRLVGAGSVAVAELTEPYRHGYLGDLTIAATDTSASPALAVGLLAETVCGPVRVNGAPGEGVVITNAQNSEFWSWQVANCKGNGLVVDGGAMNLEFSNATIKRNTGANILLRRTDVTVPEQFSNVPRLIRFRGGLSEQVLGDDGDCYSITAGVDITLDGVQTSVGSATAEGENSGANASAVRIQRGSGHPLQLVRLNAVQFKADSGVGLRVGGGDPTSPIQVFVSQAHFRTGSYAIQADENSLVELTSYYLAPEVGALRTPATQPGALTGRDATVVVAASQGIQVRGGPRLTDLSGHPVWAFDGSTDQAVSFTAAVPSSWLTYDAELWWTVLQGGGAGRVTWRLDTGGAPAPGAGLAEPAPSDPVATDVAPTGQIVATTAAQQLPADGGVSTLRVVRPAGGFGGVVGLYALLLHRTS